MDTALNWKGTAVNRPDRTPKLTSASPSERLALPPPPSNSADNLGMMKMPTRAPAPQLLFMLLLLSQDVLLPKAPNSIVPRCCAMAGTAPTSAATPTMIAVLYIVILLESSLVFVYGRRIV